MLENNIHYKLTLLDTTRVTYKTLLTQVDMWQGTLTMRDIIALEMEDSSEDEEY